MAIGWPADITWYKLAYDWQTLIAGVFAIVAAIIGAIITYRTSIRQVQYAALGRKQAFAAMAALEANRIEAEATRQQKNISESEKQHWGDRLPLGGPGRMLVQGWSGC